MKTDRPWIVGGVLCVLAAGGFWIWIANVGGSSSDATQAKPARANVSAAVEPRGVVSPSIQSTPLKNEALVAGKLTLLAEFNNSSNYRHFVEQAKQRQREGGYYYAYRALRYCRLYSGSVAKSVSATDSNESHAQAHRRQQLLNEQIQACSGLLAGEIDDAYSSAFHERGVTAGDPLLAAEARLLNARTAKSPNLAERTAAVAEVLQLRDATLLHNAGKSLSQYRKQDNAYFLDGKWYAGKDEEILSAAWLLVPCSFGWECGRNDVDVKTACALQGMCMKDRNELVLKAVLNGDQKSMAAATRLSKELVSAVSEGRVKAFMP